MNYATLCANIQDVTENSFTADQLALCTQLAEEKIYNAVQIANLRKTTTLTLTANVQYLDAPTDFLSAYSLAVIAADGTYTFLLNKDPNFIREAYPTVNATGTPKHYAIFGPQVADEKELRFILGPTPSSALSAELTYFYYPVSIVTAGQTWLGDNFPSVLLNGALVEAIRIMKGEADLVEMYQKAFAESLTLLKNLGDGKQRTDAYRTGQARVAVQ